MRVVLESLLYSPQISDFSLLHECHVLSSCLSFRHALHTNNVNTLVGFVGALP
jgi:hypothetical protein